MRGYVNSNFSSLALMDKSSGFSYNNRKWYLIDWKSGLERFEKILKMYPIAEQSHRDVFLLFGYKHLTPGEKETYILLKDLALLNEKIKQGYFCKASLDYLAEVLGTTKKSQSRRIKRLKQSGLLVVRQRTSNGTDPNTYTPIRWALPDSSLLSTLILLIRRKRIFTLNYEYDKVEITQEERIKILNEVRCIIKKIPRFKEHISEAIKKDL